MCLLAAPKACASLLFQCSAFYADSLNMNAHRFLPTLKGGRATFQSWIGGRGASPAGMISYLTNEEPPRCGGLFMAASKSRRCLPPRLNHSALPSACAGKRSVFSPYPPQRGQNHAVHGFVGAHQSYTDVRKTECTPPESPKHDVEGWRGSPRNVPALCLACVLLCAAAPSFSAGFPGFFYGSAGTGGAFYGDKAMTQQISALTDADFARVILALSGGGAFILAQPLYVTLGVDSILDFNTGGTKYANYLDCSFALGIRVYPGLAGFFASVEYCAGARTNIVNLDDVDETFSTPWGNGFRLSAAYDFTYRTGGIAPIIGAAWKHIPRGGAANDDYLTVYISLGYRTRAR